MFCIHIWIPHKIPSILSIHRWSKHEILPSPYANKVYAKSGPDLLNILDLLGEGGGLVSGSEPAPQCCEATVMRTGHRAVPVLV